MLTLKDIAREAKVSATVVSAVINNKANIKVFVNEVKKQEILEIVRKHNFVPNKRARELASSKTNTIGIILHKLTPYFSMLLEELNKHLVSKGYDLIPFVTDGDPRQEEKFLNLMCDGRVDGIVITGLLDGSHERYEKFAKPPYNLKIATRNPGVFAVPSVYFDELEAGRLAAAHLMGTGIRNLAVFGPNGHCDRIKGFFEYAASSGANVEMLVDEGVDYNNINEIKEFAQRVSFVGTPPVGFFAYNDLYASVLLSALNGRGYSIPEEVSVIGCDNTIVCQLTYPSLSSIDTSIGSSVELLFEKLACLMNGTPVEPWASTVKPSVSVRGSTRALPTEG